MTHKYLEPQGAVYLAKVQISKQITTQKLFCHITGMVLFTLQRYKFLSKSQQSFSIIPSHSRSASILSFAISSVLRMKSGRNSFTNCNALAHVNPFKVLSLGVPVLKPIVPCAMSKLFFFVKSSAWFSVAYA